MESASNNSKSVSGIGGWILFPALALIIQPVMVFKMSFLDAMQLRSRGFTVHYVWPAIVANLMIVLMVLVVSYFFFRKRRIAPSLFIIYLMLIFAMSTILQAFVPNLEVPFIAYIFSLFYFPVYFLFSRRVKATFVQPVTDGNRMERRFLRLEPGLIRFFSWLQRRRWWLPVLVILYIAAVVILQCVIRAWRIDGNILNFPKYL